MSSAAPSYSCTARSVVNTGVSEGLAFLSEAGVKAGVLRTDNENAFVTLSNEYELSLYLQLLILYM